MLHDLILGNGQIRDIYLIIIFNKKPDISKKQGETKQETVIFQLDKIREINNAWTECPFNNDQLKKFFDVDKLSKIVKTSTFLFDVNEKNKCQEVFSNMAEELNAK